MLHSVDNLIERPVVSVQQPIDRYPQIKRRQIGTSYIR